MTCAMVLFVWLGTPAGYVSARIYKSFGGEKWKSNVLLTAMLCPGYVQICVLFLIDRNEFSGYRLNLFFFMISGLCSAFSSS